MKTKIVLFIFLAFFINLSCNKSRKPFESVYSLFNYEIIKKNEVKSTKEKLIKYIDNQTKCYDTIICNKYYIRIISFPSDSVLGEPGNKIQYKYPMMKQVFELYYNQQLIKTFEIPMEKQKYKLKDGGEVKIQDQIFHNIGVIEGKNDTLFFIEGFGGCNACESSNLLVDLKGKIRVFQYIDAKYKHVKEIGNYTTEMKKIGFDLRKYETNKFRTNDLFCNDDTFELFLGL